MPHKYCRQGGTWLTLMLALACVPTSAVAEPPVEQNTPQALKQEWAGLVSALAEIERTLLVDEPRLAAMHRQFRRQVLQTMQDEGYPAMTVMRRLYDLRRTLARLEPGTKRYVRLARSYEMQSRELLSAQRRAMQDRQLQQVRAALLETTLNSMRETSEEARSLLERIGWIRDRLTSMERLALGPASDSAAPAEPLTAPAHQR